MALEETAWKGLMKIADTHCWLHQALKQAGEGVGWEIWEGSLEEVALS